MPVAPHDLVDRREPRASHVVRRGKHSKPRRPLVYTVFLAVVALMALALIAGRFGLLGVRALSVESGSMEPSIRQGSVIVTTPESMPAVGAVVTYRHPLDPNILITHRVVGYEGEGDDLHLVTQGDANNAPDSDPVPLDAVVGQVRFAIPGLGRIIGWARTDLGLIVLIIVPATVVVHNEVLRLRDQLAERRRTRRDPQQAD